MAPNESRIKRLERQQTQTSNECINTRLIMLNKRKTLKWTLPKLFGSGWSKRYRFFASSYKWIHHYTFWMNEQSHQFPAKRELFLKRAKRIRSAGKVIATVFCDSSRILFIDYVQKGKTITVNIATVLSSRHGWPCIMVSRIVRQCLLPIFNPKINWLGEQIFSSNEWWLLTPILQRRYQLTFESIRIKIKSITGKSVFYSKRKLWPLNLILIQF